MPGEHGLSTLDELRGSSDTKNIPIVVSTNLEKAYPIAKEKNVEGFILKSQNSTLEIANTIKEILEKRSEP